MSKDSQLQFDGYYVTIWSDRDSMVFNEKITHKDNYLRFYEEDNQVIAASRRPMTNGALKEWITTKFYRWTDEDFEKAGKPPYYNVNDDPDHPYIISEYSFGRRSHMKFVLKSFKEGEYIDWSYEGTVDKDSLIFTVTGTDGKLHKEKYRFVPFADIKYTNKMESNLYRNFVMHHFTSHFGGKPQKFMGDLGFKNMSSQLELFFIPPTVSHPYHVVFTCGMGKYSMYTNSEKQKYAELCMFLPPDWKVDALDLKWDRLSIQPFRSLYSLSRYPFKNWTYMDDGYTVIVGDNPHGIGFIAKMICKLSILPEYSINIDTILIEDRKINVFGVVPLYREEVDYRIQMSWGFLIDEFIKVNRNPFVFNPSRRVLFPDREVDKTKVGDNIDNILGGFARKPHTLEEWHSLFNKLLEVNELGKAYVVINRMEDLFPEDHLMYYKKAKLIFEHELKEIAVAESSVDMSIRANSKFSKSWLLLGDIYAKKEYWEKAIEAYTNCTMLEPENYIGWKSLGRPNIQTGRFARALEILQTAKSLDPSDIEIDSMIEEVESRFRRV